VKTVACCPARLGTVSSDDQVDVSPVGFEFDGEAFYVGSSDMDKSHKRKNIASGNRLVSIVIDDLGSTDAWEPRGIKVHGIADFVDTSDALEVGSGSTASFESGLSGRLSEHMCRYACLIERVHLDSDSALRLGSPSSSWGSRESPAGVANVLTAAGIR